MDAKYFCTTMQSELVGMKSRIYDIISAVENLPEDKKASAQSNLSELHTLVADLSHMIDKLKTECPVDFGTEKNAIQKKKQELLDQINVWDAEHIAGGFVGG